MILPDVFDRVEFRRIRREVQQAEVIRQVQPTAELMPAGAIQHDDSMRTRRDPAADLGEMQVHGFGIGLRQHQSRANTARRTNGAEDVGPVVALIARCGRPAALPGPDMRQAALLADTGFVLPPKFDRLGTSLMRDGIADQSCKVFLCASCADASACGCRGRTEMCRNPRRCTSLPTLRSCRGTSNSSTIRLPRSIRRQRTTPSLSGSGPARTHPAIAASCAAVSFRGRPPPCGRLNRPEIPSAL